MQHGIKIDEFVFVLLGGLILIFILTVGWNSTYQITVNPPEKTLTIARGSSNSFTLYVNGTSSNVNMTVTGDIVGWVSFERNNVDVSGSVPVLVTVNVPPSAQLKTYVGGIDATYAGGKKSMLLRINVSIYTVSELTHRVFGPEDFTVSYSVGTETVYEKGSFTVQNGIFTNKYARFVGVLSEEKLSMVTGGFLDLMIDDANSLGNLIVELNGKEIFNDVSDLGKISINLEPEQLKTNNIFVIKAGGPGWQFWTNNFYRIASAKFGIDYEGVSFKDYSFTLDSNDVNNFKVGRISFRVKNYDPGQLNDMIIKINDKIVFRDVPTLTYTSTTFGSEIPLNIGSNRISFSTEANAFYSLQDVTVTIARNV
jgi:hypothetical protein